MSSYINKKGEVVVVSKEHLNTAVELKLLLQKDSKITDAHGLNTVR